MKTAQDYWAVVERWTTPTNVKTVRLGRRDGLPHYIQNPAERTAEEISDMIEFLRRQCGED
jgi:hypothetical protein